MADSACARCGETFDGISSFDHHQDTDYGAPDPVRCLEPAAAGLTVDGDGVWHLRRGRPGVVGVERLRGLNADRARAKRMRTAAIAAGAFVPRQARAA